MRPAVPIRIVDHLTKILVNDSRKHNNLNPWKVVLPRNACRYAAGDALLSGSSL
jgi:hypothetical protein